MTCELDSADYCHRHQTIHHGRLKEIALDPSPRAERYRVRWDADLSRRLGHYEGTTAIVMASVGIGDALLCLAVCAGLMSAGKKVVYHVPLGSIPWVSLFPDAYTRLVPYSPGQPIRGCEEVFFPYDSYPVELQERSEKRRIDYYAAKCGGVEPVLPSVPEIAPDPEHQGTIVLVPYSEWRPRNWSLLHWLSLERKLLARGCRVRVLDKSLARISMFSSIKMAGKLPAEVASALAGAKWVVSGDSGMAHLAGLLGVNCLVLAGPTNPSSIFGVYGSVYGIRGKLGCGGCYWRGENYRPECAQWCADLQTITPDDVLEYVAPFNAAAPRFGGRLPLALCPETPVSPADIVQAAG